MIRQCTIADSPYEYERVSIDEFKDIYDKDIKVGKKLIGSSRNKNKYYNLRVGLGFDIETSRYDIDDEHYTWMYIWSLSIKYHNKIYVIYGSSWSELPDMLNILKEMFNLNPELKLNIFVANLGYEWQFMKMHLHVTNGFFRSKRQPFYIEVDNCIFFREALNFGQHSLAKLAEVNTNTKKAVGDLDYNIRRYSPEDLTDSEINYTDNDVLILAEYGLTYFDKYCTSHYQPVSIQQVIRRMQKNAMFEEFKPTQVQNEIRAAIPSEEDYYTMMMYLYRGGYVHANRRYCGDLIFNLPSFDLTSAYPGYMLIGYVPERFYLTNIDIKDIPSTKCWYAKFTFYNIHQKYRHSIESESKVLDSTKLKIDNGRVMSAASMSVYLTELDYDTYKKYYTWDDMEVEDIHISNKVKLPKYVIVPLFEAYTKKAELKAAGKDYTDEKVVVNSNYGVMVTKLNKYDIVWNDDLKAFDEIPTSYTKQVKRLNLLPQWGIWITAGVRNYLLDATYKLINAGTDVIYHDTDSIKPLNYDIAKSVIDDINKLNTIRVKKACKHYQLNYDIIKGLYDFDFEDTLKVFKTLGCKRYIYVDSKGHFKQTIAGLPKKQLIEYAREQRHKGPDTKVNLFDFFDNGMELDPTVKLISFYRDEPYEIEVDGHKVSEASSISLVQGSFKMSISEIFMSLMELEANKEDRIIG